MRLTHSAVVCVVSTASRRLRHQRRHDKERFLREIAPGNGQGAGLPPRLRRELVRTYGSNIQMARPIPVLCTRRTPQDHAWPDHLDVLKARGSLVPMRRETEESA